MWVLNLQVGCLNFSAKEYSSEKHSSIFIYHISSCKYSASRAGAQNQTLIWNAKYDYNLIVTKIKSIQHKYAQVDTVRVTSASPIIRFYATVVAIIYYLVRKQW